MRRRNFWRRIKYNLFIIVGCSHLLYLNSTCLGDEEERGVDMEMELVGDKDALG